MTMIPMLLFLSFIVYLGMEFTPGDPINYLVSPDQAGSANLEALREELGLNDPFLVRYVRWLGNMLKGDFGYSLVEGMKIETLIGRTLPATFELAILALVFSTIVSVLLGILEAARQNTWVDHTLSFLGVIGISIPQFFLGIVLIKVFALKLGWLPTGGRLVEGAKTIFDRIPNLILPLIAMTVSMTSALMRYTRNSMLDVMNMDYVKTARAKGIPEWKVYIKHVFRNALIPIITILCFRLPMLIGGSVIIESVFSWPGIGTVMLKALTSNDYPLIMISTLMTAVVIMAASLLVDLFTALLDPRVRLE